MLSSAVRPSRYLFLVSAAVSLLVGGMGRTAAAKDCTTDSDCDTGYQCVFAQTGDGTAGAGGSTASSGVGGDTGSTCPAGVNCGTTSSPPTKAPVPAMDAGAATSLAGADAGLLLPTPVPTPIIGICEIPCTSVADCPSADFDCAKDYIVTPTSPCPAGTKCPPQMSDTGTCVAKPHACSTAADCPAPLYCATPPIGACVSPAPSGTTPIPPDSCAPTPSVCTWVPVTCVTDNDCADPLYQCVKVSEYGWCSGSAPATCAKGETCPTAPPPTCGSTVVMNCMPKPIDCACGPCPAGVACGPCGVCPAGWSCFDFSTYNGGVRPIWSPNAPDKSCLPDGIILATQGHASDGGQFAPNSGGGGGISGLGPLDSGGAGGSGGKNGTGRDTSPASVSPVAPTSGATGNAGREDVAAVHSSGCAYGGSETGAISLWLALAMAGLVTRLARRRNRAR